MRLSNLTDETTSPERQREQVNGYAKLHGHSVVATPEDLDVSGAVSPFERVNLGPWLRDDALIAQWDGLIVAKVDRLSRSILDFATLYKWCEARGKTIISVAEHLDFGTSQGRMFAGILMLFAEFERERMSERRREAMGTLRKLGRWPGGHVPYGYRAVKQGDGWILAPDKQTAANVTAVADMLIDGASFADVTRWLETSGAATAQNGRWHSATVRRLLMSRALVGEVQHQGRSVIGDDGLPVKYAPLMTEDKFKQLQAAISLRAMPEHVRRRDSSLLLQVAFCACGAPLYRQAGRKYESGKRGPDYYFCGARIPAPNRHPDIHVTELDGRVSESLMRVHGETQLRQRVTIPGSDHTAELDEVNRSLADLQADRYERGLFRGDDGSRRFAAMMTRLEAKRETLAALPHEPARTEWVPTGETVAQRWDKSDEAERGYMLRRLGVRVTASRIPRSKVLEVHIDWGDLDRLADEFGAKAAG